jgi:hypothetical protein
MSTSIKNSVEALALEAFSIGFCARSVPRSSRSYPYTPLANREST